MILFILSAYGLTVYTFIFLFFFLSWAFCTNAIFSLCLKFTVFPWKTPQFITEHFFPQTFGFVGFLREKQIFSKKKLILPLPTYQTEIQYIFFLKLLLGNLQRPPVYFIPPYLSQLNRGTGFELLCRCLYCLPVSIIHPNAIITRNRSFVVLYTTVCVYPLHICSLCVWNNNYSLETQQTKISVHLTR